MMKTYIGTKIIQAEPAMKGETPGYFVKYPDGYTSWSPKAVFEEAYRSASGLSFGLAIEALKKGMKVARTGWSDKGMWLSLSGPLGGRVVPADKFWSEHNAAYAKEQGGSAMVLPCICMKTAGEEILMGWLANQSDMLADDWVLV